MTPMWKHGGDTPTDTIVHGVTHVDMISDAWFLDPEPTDIHDLRRHHEVRLQAVINHPDRVSYVFFQYVPRLLLTIMRNALR